MDDGHLYRWSVRVSPYIPHGNLSNEICYYTFVTKISNNSLKYLIISIKGKTVTDIVIIYSLNKCQCFNYLIMCMLKSVFMIKVLHVRKVVNNQFIVM